LVIHLRASPKNSAYRFIGVFPGLTANCMIVSMVGTADAFSGLIMKKNGILTGKFVLLLGIGCAVMLASGTDANANRIPLPPNINLTIGDQHELGQVQPPTPEGDADITQYVNFMIGLERGGSGHVIIGPHNALVTRSMNNFGSLPGPATLALRGTGTTINVGTQGTYNYLFAHYGGPGGGFAEVWYVGNLNGSISIPATGLGHGLSGWALFTAPGGAVPDGGTTVMLLGAALGALGMARRFLKI
jgi:VPDSG-CTERM motif